MASSRLESEWPRLDKLQLSIVHDQTDSVSIGFSHRPEYAPDPQSFVEVSGNKERLIALDGFIGNLVDVGCSTLKPSTVFDTFDKGIAETINTFRGQFALVYFSVADRRLVLTSDHLGIGGVFYYVTSDGALLFSTELRRLIAAASVKRQRNSVCVARMIAYSSRDSEMTLCEGVFRVPGGQLMLWSSKGMERVPYWKPDLEFEDSRPEAELISDYRERFQTAVARCLTGSVRPGVAVSGGLDSSSVLGAMLKQANGRWTPVAASARMSNYAEGNEDRFLRSLRQSMNATFASQEPRLLCSLDDIAALSDNPLSMGWFSVVEAALAVAERAQCDVALTGEFGDLVGGCSIRAAWRTEPSDVVSPKFPGAIVSSLRRAARHSRIVLRRSRCTLQWVHAALSVLSMASFDALGGLGAFATHTHQLTGLSGDERTTLWLTFETSLNAAVDNWLLASRIARVPVRHPFCDLDLVELALAMPNDLAVRGNINRFVHREALRDMIPDEIRWRTAKAYFTEYFQMFMKNTARNTSREVWRPIEDLVESSRAVQLLTPQSLGGALPRRFAFAALCLGTWLRRYGFNC